MALYLTDVMQEHHDRAKTSGVEIDDRDGPGAAMICSDVW